MWNHGPVLDIRLRAAAQARTAGSRRSRCCPRQLRGGADRAVARPDRGRRVQRAGARRRADLAADRAAARVRAVSAADRRPVQPGLPAASPARQPGDRAAACPAVRVQVRPGAAGRRGRALRGDLRRAARRPGRGREPRPRPHPPLLPGSHRGHPAHQLLPGRGRGPVPGAQARARRRARGARAAAQVRDLRVLAAVRGGAPAVRRGRARRAALVGAARGLPHRGARPGQGARGEERGHRPVRRQGRLRLQAAAGPGRPRGLPGGGARLLPDVHQRDARHHRQHRGRPGGAAARRGPRRGRRPVPGGGRGQGHRDVLRRREQDRGTVRVLAR